MEFIKKNIDLVIAAAIPIIMIILIAASIYLPRFFVKPAFNFLYISPNDSYNQNYYTVQNGKIILVPNTKWQRGIPMSVVKLYIYDVAKDTAQEISLAEAQNLNLDPRNVSPDGFEIVNGSKSSYIFPFFFVSNTNYHTYYLKGHNLSKKLNLQLNDNSGYDEFRFIGWIIK